MKVVINSGIMGFRISDKAKELYKAKGGMLPVDDRTFTTFEFSFRSDPLFVEVVEELGSREASGSMSSFRIVEIPDDVKWYIERHDEYGYEKVEEEHRSWS